MIAFRDGLPCLQFESGEVVAFQPDWLVREVRDAAGRAGYPNWWLAEHVVESVTTYLVRRYEGNVLGIAELSAAVQSVLQVTGYGDVVQYFALALPPVHISLLEIARQAGPGFELGFFDLLGQRLHVWNEQRASEFRLYDLEKTVRQLSAKKIWSRECNTLRSEIVSFVREQLDSAAIGRNVTVFIT